MSNRLNYKRLTSSYPTDIKEASYLIAFNPDRLMYYGSQAKKAMHLSSGDIDLLERVTLKDAGALTEKIQKIIKNIQSTPLTYLADFKSGVDTHYIVDIGTIKDGKVVGFDKHTVEETIRYRDFDNKKELSKLLRKKVTPKVWFDTDDILRQKQIIRWNRDELLKGYKIIRGQRVTLEDCIRQKDAMTKIDIIRFIPSLNRFVEITNYFSLVDNPEDFDGIQYINELKLSMLKCYYSQKYVKLCKRLLTYSFMKQQYNVARRLYDIVNSGIGILYQLHSELSAIQYILQHYGSTPTALIKSQLDTMKYTLGNVYEFDFDERKIDELLDNAIKHRTLANIERISDILGDIANEETRKQLESLGFLPLPKHYFP